MSKRKLIKIAFGLICSLMLVSTAVAAVGQSIDWSVIGGGGGQARTSDGQVVVYSTIGQPIIGVSSSGNTQICTGYWCEGTDEWDVYLPLLKR